MNRHEFFIPLLCDLASLRDILSFDVLSVPPCLRVRNNVVQVFRADHASGFTRSHGGTELRIGAIKYDLRVRNNVVQVLRADQEQGFHKEPRRHGAWDG